MNYKFLLIPFLLIRHSNAQKPLELTLKELSNALNQLLITLKTIPPQAGSSLDLNPILNRLDNLVKDLPQQFVPLKDAFIKLIIDSNDVDSMLYFINLGNAALGYLAQLGLVDRDIIDYKTDATKINELLNYFRDITEETIRVNIEKMKTINPQEYNKNIETIKDYLEAQQGLFNSIFDQLKPTTSDPSLPFIFMASNLVNKQNYVHYVNLEVPYILPTGNVLQQVLTLSQFLIPEILKDPKGENARGTQEATGINYAKYHKLLLRDPLNNRLIQEKITDLPGEDDYLELGGSPASCAYHALKNALYLITPFINRDDMDRSTVMLCNIKIANDYFGYKRVNNIIDNKKIDGTWRQMIIKRRTEQHNPGPELAGDWLNDAEITLLIKNSIELSPYKNNITVFESSDYSEVNYRDIKSTLAQDKGFHCFIIFLQSANADRGHWFTLFVGNVSGKKIYTIADSTNTPRYPRSYNKGIPADLYSENLEKIIQELEQ